MIQDFCFHVHTPRCGHADPTMPEDVTARLFYEAGFKTIAFTDHCPWKTFLDKINAVNHAMPYSQREDYIKTVKKLSEQYKGKMEILTGVEMEYLPEYREEMDAFRKDCNIIIIGQHFVKQSDGTYQKFHTKGYVPQNYELDYYADCLSNACKDGYADVLAHPDLFMIHQTEFTEKDREISHRICSTAEKYNVPLEINLCVVSKKLFIKPCDITYPRKEFWEIVSEYKNLRVLFGLDFHGRYNPSNQDKSIEEACKITGENTISKLNFCQREKFKF